MGLASDGGEEDVEVDEIEARITQLEQTAHEARQYLVDRIRTLEEQAAVNEERLDELQRRVSHAEQELERIEEALRTVSTE